MTDRLLDAAKALQACHAAMAVLQQQTGATSETAGTACALVPAAVVVIDAMVVCSVVLTSRLRHAQSHRCQCIDFR